MNTRVRNIAGALAMGTAVLVTPAASAMPLTPADDLFQQNQSGLVNVAIDDVSIGAAVPVNVALGIAANVCGVGAQVGVLAQQLQRTGSASCENDQTNQTVQLTSVAAG
jgi:hypothetical protein